MLLYLIDEKNKWHKEATSGHKSSKMQNLTSKPLIDNEPDQPIRGKFTHVCPFVYLF